MTVTTSQGSAAETIEALHDQRPFLDAIVANPGEWGPRLVFADWLEERGDPRGELLRLLHELTGFQPCDDAPAKEERLRRLIESGVKPVGPFVELTPGHIRFALIPPGRFRMGTLPGQPDHERNERPRMVNLTQPFFISVDPITGRQWRQVTGRAHQNSGKSDKPVDQLTWLQVTEFCELLAERTGMPLRLPTEAEWEYACRAGTTTQYYTGDGEDSLRKAGWYGRRNAETPPSKRKVGLLLPNAFGLFDMHGNVWEWCADWYGPYLGQEVTDPLGVQHGTHRVARGGAFTQPASYCRSAHRAWCEPDQTSERDGFRVCFTATP